MRWRRRIALAVLGMGWLVWLIYLAAQTPAGDPKYVSIPAHSDHLFRQARIREKCKTRRVIGYRDEWNLNTPEWEGRRNQTFLACQYAAAPILLDRDGSHDMTLVVTQTGLRLERTESKP